MAETQLHSMSYARGTQYRDILCDII